MLLKKLIFQLRISANFINGQGLFIEHVRAFDVNLFNLRTSKIFHVH